MLCGLELFRFGWIFSVLHGLNGIYRSIWLHATNSSAHPSYWFCRTMWPWFISVQPTEPPQYRILQVALYRLQTLLTSSDYISFYYETFTFVATDKLCFHRLQFRVCKSIKDLKPARILYYGSQTDANLEFFLTSPVFRFQIIPPFFFFLLLLHFNTYCAVISLS